MGLREITDSFERKGKIEGKLEGERKGKEEVARTLIDMGLNTSSIVTATGFKADAVEKLRQLPS
jgi:recombination-promoting nuclease RpnB